MGSGHQDKTKLYSGETQRTLTDSDQWVPKQRRGKIRDIDLIWHADSISGSLHVQLSGRAMSKGHSGDPSLDNVPIWCTDTQICTMSCQRRKDWTLLHIKIALQTETCIFSLSSHCSAQTERSWCLEGFLGSSFLKTTRNSTPIP